MAKAGAAMRFGNQHPGKAHLGHLRPGAAVKTRRIGRVAQAAMLGNRGFGLEETVRRLADHLLVVGEH